MAIYFLYMKTFGRGGGSSSVGASAYRAGERIRDERSGRVFDHSHRPDVMHKEIMVPAKLADTDMAWATDRASLWNAVESSETRKNARVAREFLVALPAELTDEQRLGLVRGFARDLTERHQFALDLAVHAPRDDPRNFHAHLLASTRAIHSSGFGSKTALEVSDAVRGQLGLPPFFQEVNHLRAHWADRTNQALRAANIAVRVDHRSLEAQGIDRDAQPRLPRAIFEIERRGEYSAAGAAIRAAHAERAQAPAVTMEEIRRQAREAWLEKRRQERSPGDSLERSPHRSPDDDRTR